MARLHEYQGKAALRDHGIEVPRSGVARSADEAASIAREMGGAVVVKIQAWTTGRAALGGVKMADTPAQARAHAGAMLGMRIGNFPVTELLIEEKLDIARELFVSLTIDDAARRPMVLLSLEGGTGIEDRAEAVHRLAVHVSTGIDRAALEAALAGSTIDEGRRGAVAEAIVKIVETAAAIEARSLEVNPLVITGDGRVMAADCRVTVDDYAVFRHPELGIEIARELDHPPTELERIAFRVEEADHRGTFYFARLPHSEDDPKLVGFHGAGGGGSMMSMDAVTNAGFTIANFTDTSGNPSSAKVYAAARIILSQPGLVGYFGSGSGVASQEQFWSAYGLAKAFFEVGLSIPAVIRLGGNSEDRAVEILNDACKELPAVVEGYRKDDTPQFCAERFRELVEASGDRLQGTTREVPAFVGKAGSLSVKIDRGTLWVDLDACDSGTTALVVRHSSGLLKDEGGKPAIALSDEELAGKDSELIACEVECRRVGKPVVFVDIPIEGLD
ncbi:MAG: acetate--CoA ligase family protein [Phycisphaeraceae bacterium]|nr:MAG: acetate--CoA ligase family protein [Phycisphaeraceae bacterium]